MFSLQRTTKDGVRAVINCFDKLITKFYKLLRDDLVVVPKVNVAPPSNDYSANLTKDQLRENATRLIQFFLKWVMPQVLKAFRENTSEYYIRHISLVVDECSALVYEVAVLGSNCGKDNEDDGLEWF